MGVFYLRYGLPCLNVLTAIAPKTSYTICYWSLYYKMSFKELKKEEKQTSLKASKVYNGVLSRKQLETSTENVQSRLYFYLFIVLYPFLILARISKY
jgi:anaerobic C4-dicarboxylate transporter